ncbi:alpha/beta fold hydrolase [Streptomyces sp. BE147]|uniref:thioesterase II family protein n=1 Tax=Streptomyces sp. BE147 TaxID=3002524 RepID=UPI002E78D389|nr:alpha/beta fold hydrolase [Streptomyces sp. BE147]MEE1737877.1 alpha/beta fold hydrolase [Streptomyces sp. BE147]
MTPPAPWQQNLRLLASPDEVRARLICAPPAGGAANFFRPWAADLPAGLELWALQLPGREDRLTDPVVPDLVSAARHLARAVQWLTEIPYALFGHSMGALIAYETASILQAQHAAPPRRLLVSGCVPPDRQVPRSIALDTDQQVLAELRRIGFDTKDLAHPEAAAVALPAIRNDLHLFYSYEHRPRATLTCPVTALAGDSDHNVPTAELPGWRRCGPDGFRSTVLPGSHYYLLDGRKQVIGIIAEALGLQNVPGSSP